MLELVKYKLNITWDDPGTNARLEAIIAEAVPVVSNMVAVDEDFDFEQPSMERNVFLNFCAYEWNHQADLFWDNYAQDIAACRQKNALEDANYGCK